MYKTDFHVYLLHTGHSPDSDPNHSQSDQRSEPVFVDPSRSPEIDSQPGGSVCNPICRTGPPGYIGWRNRFLGIDSWAPLLFTNTGSDICANYSQSSWALMFRNSVVCKHFVFAESRHWFWPLFYSSLDNRGALCHVFSLNTEYRHCSDHSLYIFRSPDVGESLVIQYRIQNTDTVSDHSLSIYSGSLMWVNLWLYSTESRRLIWPLPVFNGLCPRGEVSTSVELNMYNNCQYPVPLLNYFLRLQGRPKKSWAGGGG